MDNQFAFGLEASVVHKFGLKEGDRLTENQVTDLLLKEEKKRVKQKAYRFLSARSHSKEEMRTKLARKGFDKRLIEETISELETTGLVDDTEFALSYARNRLANRPIGEKLLRYELGRKGISEEIVEQTVREAYSERDQMEFAKELVEKTRGRFDNLAIWEKKKRLGDLLARRGFSWDLVHEVVSEAELLEEAR